LAAQDEIPGLGSRADRPRLNRAADLNQQKLSPTEGFVLSRVDGQSSYDDICLVSGLPKEKTLEILRGLKRAKLILGPHQREAEAIPPSAREETSVSKAARSGERSAAKRSPGPLERLDDGTPVVTGELADWPEAEPLLKERIIRLHRRMKKLGAHELLGIPEQADTGTLRRAFAVASKELHPDRYFGKNLGSFKGKLAAIFTRMTEAMQEIESGQKNRR